MIAIIVRLLLLLCLFASGSEGLEAHADSHLGDSRSSQSCEDKNGQGTVDSSQERSSHDHHHESEDAHQCHLGHCGALSQADYRLPKPNSFEAFSVPSGLAFPSAFLSEAGDPPRA